LATTAFHFPADLAKLRSVLDRHGVTIATILLLALLAWLLARWTWQFLQPKETITPPVASAKIDVNAATERVVGMHLFGVAGERKNSEEAQVSTLNLHLKGVFAFSRESPAFAIVNTGDKNDEAFKVGDEIAPGALLAAVHPTHIIIKRAGALEKVPLEERPGSIGTAAPRSQFRLNVPSTAPGNYNLSRGELTSSLQDPKQVANLGRVNANPGGGVVVEEVPPNSLAERLGLQPGDIIRNVNGKPTNSPADLGRLYQQLGQTPQVQVDGSRGNRPLNLTYNMQQ
jgi:general secretion pathway protein C